MPLPRYSPMLASSARGVAFGDDWCFEPKLDGWRALVFVDDDGFRVRSRTGRDITAAVPELARLSTVLDGRTAVLDGELVAGNGTPWDFYRLGSRMAARSSARAADRPVAFVAFDVLWLDGDLTRQPHEERRAALESLRIAGNHWCTAPVLGRDPAMALELAARFHLEGVVAKRQGSPYRPGQRSPHWVKLKTPEWRAVHAPLRQPAEAARR